MNRNNGGILASRIFAVAGASTDPGKFGHIIFQRLLSEGYEVFPINPNAQNIGTHRCYPELAAIPVRPQAVICVTPPAVSTEIARHFAGLPRGTDPAYFWMQPGAESDEAVRICRENNIEVTAGECILIELNRY